MKVVPMFFAALVVSLPAGAQGTQYTLSDSSYQVSYATNLMYGDSYVTLSNSGAISTVALPIQNGNLCVNVYTYDPHEQLIACCSCLVTPNALDFLSVKKDLILNTLTPGVPTSVVIKLLSSSASSCNPATVGMTGNLLAPGMLAWSTTLAQTTAGVFSPERTPFIPATLSSAELKRMTTLCSFIQSNGSGYGICGSCRSGAAGGASKQ
ncbi:MAG TPA: hypothetical protein VLY24_12070 [Bryobacteraceae bacterium]|nr:hypothetical protein [Bryobacteraceae bacterium]